MRRVDKKYNIQKANVLLEASYLKSKLNEVALPYVTLSKNNLITKLKQIVEEICNGLWYKNNVEFLSTQDILNGLQHDMGQLMEKERLTSECERFEEELMDVYGDDITMDPMDIDAYYRLMDPNATLDSLNAPAGSEHDSLLDDDGNLNYGSGEKVRFEKPMVSGSKLEAFVKKNPNLQPILDKYNKLLYQDVMFQSKMLVFHEFSYSIKDFQRAIAAVKQQNVTATFKVKHH